MRSILRLALSKNLSPHVRGYRKPADIDEHLAGLIGLRHILSKRSNAIDVELLKVVIRFVHRLAVYHHSKV